MKAEAWFDRTGPEKQKYLLDLSTMRERVGEEGVSLKRKELRRLVELRDARKHDEMIRTIERVFAGQVQ
jgi:predicted RNA-binding protein